MHVGGDQRGAGLAAAFHTAHSLVTTFITKKSAFLGPRWNSKAIIWFHAVADTQPGEDGQKIASCTEAAAFWSNLELTREDRAQRPGIKPQEKKRKSQRVSEQQKYIWNKDKILSAAGTKYFTEISSHDCTLEVFAPWKEAILHFSVVMLNHLTFIQLKNIKNAASPNQTCSSLRFCTFTLRQKSLNLFLSVTDSYFFQSFFQGFFQSFFHFHIQDHDRDPSNSLPHSWRRAGGTGLRGRLDPRPLDNKRGKEVKNVDYWRSKEVFEGAEVQVQSGGRQLWLCSFIYDRIHVKLHFKKIKLGLKGDIHLHFQPSINTSTSAHVLMRAALFFWFLSRRWSCTQTEDYRYSSYSWTTFCWSWNSLNTNVMSELSSASSASVTIVHTDPGVLVQKVTSFTS